MSQAGSFIMVWAGFTYDCRIALEVIKGNMIATKYRDVLPDVFQQAQPAENFILVDDNAMSHRARAVTTYKQANNIIIED